MVDKRGDDGLELVRELVSSVRVGLVLALWIMMVVGVTYPVHAQSAEISTGSISRTSEWGCISGIVCPQQLEISIVQGQGQVCWAAKNYAGVYMDRPTQECTNSTVAVWFYSGDMVTFTATGSSGYVFDHWIMPDKDTYSANPIGLSIPVPVDDPMVAVFAKGTAVPEFPQAFLILGAVMILGMAILRRANASRFV